MAIFGDFAQQALKDAVDRMEPVAQDHKDLAKAHLQLEEAKAMLQARDGEQFPSMQQTAKAYNRVLVARGLVHKARPGAAEEPIKDAGLTVREVLVIMCLSACEDGSRTAFQAVLTNAFNKDISLLDHELDSQMHLARSRIKEAGQNFDACNMAPPKVFKQALSNDHRMEMFAAYRTMSHVIVDKSSRSSQKSKNKPPRPAKKKRTQSRTLTCTRCLSTSTSASP